MAIAKLLGTGEGKRGDSQSSQQQMVRSPRELLLRRDRLGLGFTSSMMRRNIATAITLSIAFYKGENCEAWLETSQSVEVLLL